MDIGVVIFCSMLLVGVMAFMISPRTSIDTLLPNKYCMHRIGDKFIRYDGSGYNLMCCNCYHITEYKFPSVPPPINRISNAPVAQLDRADAS